MEPDVYAAITCSPEVPDGAGRVRGDDGVLLIAVCEGRLGCIPDLDRLRLVRIQNARLDGDGMYKIYMGQYNTIMFEPI